MYLPRKHFFKYDVHPDMLLKNSFWQIKHSKHLRTSALRITAPLILIEFLTIEDMH